MGTSKGFGAALARARKEQGFASAHKFFRSVGGSRSLGLSFMSYWDIERGKKLPRSWRLKSIMAALGIEQDSEKARELVRSYFRELSGSDELLRIISGPPSPAGPLTDRELAEFAAHRAVAQRTGTLTLEQWRLRSRDKITCICQNFIINTAGWVTIGEIRAATGFAPPAIKKALRALVAGGLVELSGDRARSPFSGKVIRPMPATPATASMKVSLRRIFDEWLSGARLVDSRRMTMRMTRASLDIYRRHLEKFVELCCVYSSSSEDRLDSDVYCVDASIYRMYPRG